MKEVSLWEVAKGARYAYTVLVIALVLTRQAKEAYLPKRDPSWNTSHMYSHTRLHRNTRYSAQALLLLYSCRNYDIVLRVYLEGNISHYCINRYCLRQFGYTSQDWRYYIMCISLSSLLPYKGYPFSAESCTYASSIKVTLVLIHAYMSRTIISNNKKCL